MVHDSVSGAARSAAARVAIGGILHETHSFMQDMTTLAGFAAQSLHFGDELLSSMRNPRTGIGGMIDGATEFNWQLSPTLYAAAMPAGIITQGAYRKLLSELTNRLARHMPLDGLLLALHGAMVAEGLLDAETDIVARVRAIVGGAAPIVVLLDMHGNISPRLVELADVLLAYNTNPHIDAYARGVEALAAMLAQDIREGPIVLADPEAVAICWTEGNGAEVTLAVGGKVDDWHGPPVTVTGKVRALSDGVFECELPDNHFASFYGDTVHMGRSVWLRVEGLNILLTERKTPPLDLAQLRHIGIVPETQSMIVVKSAVAYRAAYLPIASAVIEMDTAGLCSANLSRSSYQHLKRPVFPLD
ncbi:MAG: M81 family metallopeptidase [Chloroflexi bacterium]|nr:M81 family metallopeptidase [Chloroflexota bacterium]